LTRIVVLEPGEGPSAGAVFLRDRFHIVAFALPFLWFAGHRLYLAAVFALLVQAGLVFLSSVPGFGFAAFVLLALFGLAVALEGPRFVAASLRRRGYREAAVLHVSDLDEAEIRYFSIVGQPPTDGPETAPAVAPRPTPPVALPLTGWRSARTLLDAGPR
jgi:hypothetical protein